MEGFLAAQGWQNPHRNELESTWTKSDGDRIVAHVAVPQNPTKQDYASLIRLALMTYSTAESVPYSEVVEDVATRDYDILRVRLSGGALDRGRVKLVDTPDLMKGVRELFYAAASAVEKKEPFFHPRGPARIDQFIHNLEFAPPERGSFVVKILSPVRSVLEEQDAMIRLGALEPFARKATSTLFNSLTAAVDAATEAAAKSDITVFKDRVGQGVSANLCEALTHISAASPLVGVDVSATWSVRRPPSDPNLRRTVVPPPLLPIIEQGATFLRGKKPEDPIEIVGLVFLLKESKKAGEQAIGLQNLRSEGPQRVRVRLSPAQYKHAIEAHGTDHLIRVLGVVKRKGVISYMDDPMTFEVLGAPPPSVDIGLPEMRRDIESWGPGPPGAG